MNRLLRLVGIGAAPAGVLEQEHVPRAAPGSARGALGPPRQELADGACATLGALRKRGRCRKTPSVERREARSRDRKRGRHASQACLGRFRQPPNRRLRKASAFLGAPLPSKGSAKMQDRRTPRLDKKQGR